MSREVSVPKVSLPQKTKSVLILLKERNRVLSLLLSNGQLAALSAWPDETENEGSAGSASPSSGGPAARESAKSPGTPAARLNSIYVGKVMNVAKNINAAFVELTKGQRAFLPLSHMASARILNRKADGRILAGDELLVQVEREAVKTKEPVLTTDISLAGRYAVVFPGKESGRLQFSGKLSDKARQQITEALAAADIREETLTAQGCGLIVRTNAGALLQEDSKTSVHDEGIPLYDDAGQSVRSAGAPLPANTEKPAADDLAPLIREAQALIRQAVALWQNAGMRTCYSCLYRPESGYLTEIRDTPQEQYEEILTDDPALYEEIRAFLERSCPQALSALRLYQDSAVSLRNLYGLPAKIREACGKRVWLKSGGYLVIEPTEALTVIDVNSGKYTGKKGMRDTFRLINREAALEIARQLRLRNLSGIILVDFISMEKKEDEKELLQLLSAELKKDPVKTAVVDMTPLGLVEITRKKVRRSIYEQLSEFSAAAGKENHEAAFHEKTV